jgi:HSP20 family protein
MTLVKFNYTKKINNFPPFNELFDSFLKDSYVNDKAISKSLAVNISEYKEHFYIELAAPRLKKKDFKISIDKDL